jgi:UDP-N-acetylglucosamine--N-acetylmuramyl-(pentapeptide) pyrophosphoryl-undecaprenol N-acetylglucosamine transferase
MTRRVLITAGGTGGHIFPALVIAKHLRMSNIEVAWLGTHCGLEAKVIPQNHIPLYYINIAGLRRCCIGRLLLAPFQLLWALFQSLKVIHQYNPDVVFGTGGFVAGPSGLAAWLLRKRLVILEQNAVMGMTNRILSRFADCVLTGFEQVSRASAQYKYVGNPVRDEIAKLEVPDHRFSHRTDRINLLIFGGSQGASVFNKVLPEVVASFPEQKRPRIWHQVGINELERTKTFYEKLRVDAKVCVFIENMDNAYRWADLVVCRAGASTISELTTVGIASILVPYQQAVDDHQTVNARFLTDSGAAILLSENDFTCEKIVPILSMLISDRVQLLNMANIARSLREENVIDQVMKELL